MPRFRKKPVEVEAEQFSEITKDRVFHFAGCVNKSVGFDDTARAIMKIQLPEGVVTVHVGDWVVRGSLEGLSVCKPDIFDATYEPVEENSP